MLNRRRKEYGSIKYILLLTLISSGLAVLGAEVGLQITGKFTPLPYPPEPRLPELYRYVEPYGYALWPSRTMQYAYPRKNPRRLTVHANSHGFRNSREFAVRDERFKILVVGDSYVFGEGVEEPERFSNLVEQMEPDWQVDNVGMIGYGPDLMLLALAEIAPIAKPDAVLLVLSYDDFRRIRKRYAGIGYPIPRLALQNEILIKTPYPKPYIWERSHLYHGIWLAFSKQAQAFTPLTAEEWALNRAILDQILAISKQQKFSLLLSYLPGPWKDQTHVRRRNWLQRYALKRTLPFLDLSAAIHSADPDEVYIPDNTHYGPGGHKITAQEVHRFFKTNATIFKPTPSNKS